MSSRPENTPSTAVRVLLVLLSILLCICLFASLVATALLIDARMLTDKNGFEAIINSMITPHSHPHARPVTGAAGGLRLAEDATDNALVSFLFDALKSQYGEELPVTEEQMQTILEKSTVKDFLADKTASYMSDFVNGTKNTTITSEELQTLIEENKALIEDTFDVEITPDIQSAITSAVEDMDIGNVIENEVLGNLADLTIPGAKPLFPQLHPETDGNNATGDVTNSALNGEYTLTDLMADIRILTSTPVLICAIALCVTLIVALFFTNRMRLAGTLTCVGIPALLAGILLMIPTALLGSLPQLLPADLAAVGSAVAAMSKVIAPVHYILAIAGLVLIVAAIVVKSISSKRAAAAQSMDDTIS